MIEGWKDGIVTSKGGGSLSNSHVTVFKGQKLLFVGYELQVMSRENFGLGLKTTIDILKGTYITQYEVGPLILYYLHFHSYSLLREL